MHFSIDSITMLFYDGYMEANTIPQAKISEAALRASVQAMGGNPENSDHRIVSAMVMDPEFREQVTRFMFNRALEMVAR